MEAYCLYLFSLLGTEESVRTTLAEIDKLEETVDETSLRMDENLQSESNFSKKEVLNYFRWTLTSARNMENLRIALTFTK